MENSKVFYLKLASTTGELTIRKMNILIDLTAKEIEHAHLNQKFMQRANMGPGMGPTQSEAEAFSEMTADINDLRLELGVIEAHLQYNRDKVQERLAINWDNEIEGANKNE